MFKMNTYIISVIHDGQRKWLQFYCKLNGQNQINYTDEKGKATIFFRSDTNEIGLEYFHKEKFKEWQMVAYDSPVSHPFSLF